MGEEHWRFVSAAQAVGWSAEVLRRRRWARLSRIWDELAQVGEGWRGGGALPTTAGERYALAIAVDGLVRGLGEGGMLLRAQAWGDWCDEELLRAALLRQEVLRREGVRVRLHYTYSQRQLAALVGVSAPTVARRVGVALGQLEGVLRGRGWL